VCWLLEAFEMRKRLFYHLWIRTSSNIQINHPIIYTINLIFIALSRRHRSTCFGHYCVHHQEPPPTVFAASGYRMIAGVDVFPAVFGLLVRVCAGGAELHQHTL
jgi:hypothetical protein